MEDLSSLYRLLSWFSPSYPIGSFNYSHGIEYAIHSRLVTNAKSLENWIQGILEFGTGRLDAMLFNAAYRSPTELPKLISLSNALKASPELWAESHQQGAAALKILSATYPSIALQQLACHLQQTKKRPALAIVFAVACADNKVPLREALTAFLYGFSSNLVLVGLKLIPLGQTDGQNIMLRLENTIKEAVRLALDSTIDDVGTATPMIDWTSAKHETQYTRLFQS